MAKNDKKDGSDQIRVVDDAEVAEEAVVRLDAPKRAPIERKEAASEDRALPQMMGDAREVEEARAEAFDPEKAWLNEAEKKEVKSMPFGWFVLLGLAFAGVLMWVVAQNVSSSGQGQAGGGTSSESQNLPLSEMEELDEIEKAKAHYRAMETIVTQFFASESVEELSKYVRDVDRVLPFMKDYYQRNPLKAFKYKETLEYHVVSLENFPFMALNVELENGDTKPLLVEDSPEGLKIDWESFVCYQPVDIEEFIKERVVEPVDLRVYVQRDQFYAYDFADESRYSSYQLTFRGSDLDLFGYVERGTKLEEEFRKLFPPGSSTSVRNPLILRVSFLPGTRASRSVKIHELRSKLWSYPPGAHNAASKPNNESLIKQ
ncbi:hypothetical protein V2O64_08930 [Verrucomicrobiaceae bacterium 227]